MVNTIAISNACFLLAGGWILHFSAKELDTNAKICAYILP
jgi:hypothetical protein